MRRFGFPYPMCSFPIGPLPLSFGLIFDVEPNPMSMHLVILPLTQVSIAVHEHFFTVAIYFTLIKVAFILGLIRPCHNSFAIHIIILEFSFIKFASVSKEILPITMELAIDKVTFIEATFKFKPSLA